MFKEAGKERIDVRTILDEAAPKIKDFPALASKLEQLSGSHDTCNVSEFYNWMKVSRQTVYNWRDCGYLVYSGRKVNLPETLELWLSLPWLGSASGALNKRAILSLASGPRVQKISCLPFGEQDFFVSGLTYAVDFSRKVSGRDLRVA